MWLRSLLEQTLTGVKRAQRVTLVKSFMQHTIILSSLAIIAIFCPIVYYFIEPPAATWSAAVEWAATTMTRAIWQEILNLTQFGLGVGQGVLQSARTLVTALVGNKPACTVALNHLPNLHRLFGHRVNARVSDNVAVNLAIS